MGTYCLASFGPDESYPSLKLIVSEHRKAFLIKLPILLELMLPLL